MTDGGEVYSVGDLTLDFADVALIGGADELGLRRPPVPVCAISKIQG
jgi:hypothetical protein